MISQDKNYSLLKISRLEDTLCVTSHHSAILHSIYFNITRVNIVSKYYVLYFVQDKCVRLAMFQLVFTNYRAVLTQRVESFLFSQI